MERFCRNCGRRIDSANQYFCDRECLWDLMSRMEMKAFIRGGELKYPELLDDISKLRLFIQAPEKKEIGLQRLALQTLESLSDTSRLIAPTTKYHISLQ